MVARDLLVSSWADPSVGPTVADIASCQDVSTRDAFIEGYGQAAARANTTVVTTPLGGVIEQRGELTSDQVRKAALGQVGSGNLRALLSKEVLVGALNGVAWAFVVGAVSALWFSDLALGLVIAGAMAINLLVAALAGVLVPLFLRRMNVDPALAGGVVLTTVTDVVGFLSFLGLATLVLLR